ncbi:response regulator [Lysobacter capsici]|uniref:response regulator n=1 Tax=Lysobacter capsici TaxID=435897 RepID=UPI001C004333|nr:response regulator [Lysobacter capsici]QWF17544.1 response regulator [Lysobacter capsici]
MRILIAEDDPAIASGLSDSLIESGHAVDRVNRGNDADAALRDDTYDLVVLDLGLPQLDGLSVLRRARSRGESAAVLVVTAREGVGERVRALDSGADDYLIKPFVLEEFAARVRALLRRRVNQGIPMLSIGRLRIDLAGRRGWNEDVALDLTGREFALLDALLSRRGRLVSREQLTQTLCNWEQDITNNGLDIAIHRLRRKLEGTDVTIRTIRGLGYVVEEIGSGERSS